MDEMFAWFKNRADDALAEQRLCERRAKSFWSWLFRDREFWREKARWWERAHSDWLERIAELERALETAGANSRAHGPGKEDVEVERP